MPDFIELPDVIINKSYIVKIEKSVYRSEMSYKFYLNDNTTIEVNAYDNYEYAKKIKDFIRDNT